MSYLIDLYILCKLRSRNVYQFLEFVNVAIPISDIDFDIDESTFDDVIAHAIDDPSFIKSLYSDMSKRFRTFSIHYIGDGAVLYSITVDSTEEMHVRALLEKMLEVLDGDFAFAAAETPPAVDLEDLYQWVLVAPVSDWVIGEPRSIVTAHEQNEP